MESLRKILWAKQVAEISIMEGIRLKMLIKALIVHNRIGSRPGYERWALNQYNSWCFLNNYWGRSKA